MNTVTPVIVPVAQDAPYRSPLAVQRQREAARCALTECARRCGAPLDGWTQDGKDRPVPNEGHYWSISHGRGLAGAVIAGKPVGIDVEEVIPRDRDLSRALATDTEWAIVGDRSWDSFFRVWTAKEATLKANGAGIAELLDCRLVGIEGDRQMTLAYRGQSWRVEQCFHANHVVTVTCSDASIEWVLLD